LKAVFFILMAAFLVLPCAAQSPVTSGETIAIVPFDNRSKAPGIEWISESFPELLAQRLSSPHLYVIPREERIRAYEQAGLPVEIHPSRATLYRTIELLDVDYLVLGSFDFDGRVFTANAQLLDMRHQQLLPTVTESGPLTALIDIQTALAWDLLRVIRPNFKIDRDAFVHSAPPVRLDALENYVRGVIATTNQEQIRRFNEAVRLSPGYTQALLYLGKVYFKDRKFAEAINAFARISPSDPASREGNFWLGLAAYYIGQYDRAETAFGFVAARLPLSEVYNNLGVVESRRGKKSAALGNFQQIVLTDPRDPDYRFNLAVALYRNGDLPGAGRAVRETLTLRPTDTEAFALQEEISSQTAGHPPTQKFKLPLERIETNYDESPFRQMALSLQAANEEKLSRTDARSHAQFHVERGHEFLTQGFVEEAEAEFREAISLDPSNPGAHSGLARVLETDGDLQSARNEADAALRLRPSAEALLVLARLDLRDNKLETAGQYVDRALGLSPDDAAAQLLKRTIAAKLAEKAQPLPNP
jgi:tetratricopeptide (TPR) repeat protein